MNWLLSSELLDILESECKGISQVIMDAQNDIMKDEFPKEVGTNEVSLKYKSIIRLVAYSDEESDEEMSIVEPDSTVDIVIDKGPLNTEKDTEQCKDEMKGENVCSSTDGRVLNDSNTIESSKTELTNYLMEQKQDILMSGNLDRSHQFNGNLSVSQQERQHDAHFFGKLNTDDSHETSNACQEFDRKDKEAELSKEIEEVMQESGQCNFPETEPENNNSINDSFCDMSDLAFIAEIVAQTPSTSPSKSKQSRRITDQKENDDLLERASQQLGKNLIAVESDASETEDSSEDSDSESSSESSSSSSTTSSSSSSESSDDETSVEQIRQIIDYDENQGVNLHPPKTKDEVLPQELPQEPEIDIELPDDAKLDPIGEIQSYVEMMIVIKAHKDTPALDAETLFFLEDRKLIGMVFDVFGPVTNPFYVIRLDREEKFKNMGIKVGDPVFYAPNYLNMTNYVFVEQLKRMKGSDASWQHDQEPPRELLEYSDDEEEAKAKAAAKKRRQNERKELESYDADADDDVEMQNKPQRNKNKQGGNLGNDPNQQNGEAVENGSAGTEPNKKPTRGSGRGRGRGRGRGTQPSLTPTHSYPQHGNVQGSHFPNRGNRPTLLHNDIGQHNTENRFDLRYPGPGGPQFRSDSVYNAPPMFAPNRPPPRLPNNSSRVGAQSRRPDSFNGPHFSQQGGQFSTRGPMHRPGYQFPGMPMHAPHPPMFDPTVPPPAANSMPPHFDPSMPPPGMPPFDANIPPPMLPPNIPPPNWNPPS